MKAMSHNTFRSYPLAPFEKYMLMDDSQTYSMTCHIRIWFDGEFLQNAFCDALLRTLEQHPFLRSKLHSHPGRFGFENLTFDEAPIILEEILDWGNFETPAVAKPLDKRDLRTRFFVRTGDGKSLIVVRFHHAISDGQGIYGFMDDLLRCYDAICNGVPHTPVRRNQPLLKKRLNLGLNGWHWLRRSHLDFRRFLKFVTRFPKPMASTLRIPDHAPARLDASLRVVIPEAALVAFKTTAKELKATFNELLIARLFRRALAWNAAHGTPPRPRDVYRMNVPISMRESHEDVLPAANYVSMVFLDRTAFEIENEVLLTHSITEEMSQIKRHNMGLTLIRSIAAMTRFNFFQRFLRLPLCMSTVGLTNLGRPFTGSQLRGPDGLIRAGNVIVTGTDTLPPLRDLTRALFSVNRYNDHLSITLRWDTRTIVESDARRFLAGFVTALTTTQNEAVNTETLEGVLATEAYGLY